MYVAFGSFIKRFRVMIFVRLPKLNNVNKVKGIPSPKQE